MPVDYITWAGLAGILAFLWNLHRDIRALDRRISDLAERIAKLEGQVGVLLQAFVERNEKPAR